MDALISFKKGARQPGIHAGESKVTVQAGSATSKCRKGRGPGRGRGHDGRGLSLGARHCGDQRDRLVEPNQGWSASHEAKEGTVAITKPSERRSARSGTHEGVELLTSRGGETLVQLMGSRR